jgi:hypothetical protein
MGGTARGLDVVEPLGEVDHYQVVAWVRASCEAQGLPEKVSDAAVLHSVAVLLRPALAGSPIPKRRYSRRVKLVAATNGGGDGDVVEDGGNDAALPGEGEV